MVAIVDFGCGFRGLVALVVDFGCGFRGLVVVVVVVVDFRCYCCG